MKFLIPSLFARTRAPLFTVLALLLPLSGCGSSGGSTEAPAVTPPPPPPKPYLIHMPGISGELNVDRSMIQGLRDGDFDGEVEIFDWTKNDPGLDALFARTRNAGEAKRLSELIVQRARQNPAQKIFLTGHSGGTGIAVWALEKLPADVSVEEVLLLSPALSPTYDLSTALKHVRGKAYAFTSPNDAIVLGLGTRLFATMDGQRVEAAGRVGFTMPADPKDPEAYKRLIAMPYNPAWMKLDNIGDHVGVLSRRFSANVLAPLITGKAPPTSQGTAGDDEGLSDNAVPE